MRSPSRTSDMSATQSTSFMNLDECLPKIRPSLQPPPDYKNSVEKFGKLSKPKKRSSTGRDSGVARITPSSLHSDSFVDPADNQNDVSTSSPPMKYDRTEDSFVDPADNQNDVSTSSPPMKYDRTEESPVGAGHISRSERRTQSVRTKS
ncbi:hypothetical protein COOONC_10609, partial [Cooperia oncophora]